MPSKFVFLNFSTLINTKYTLLEEELLLVKVTFGSAGKKKRNWSGCQEKLRENVKKDRLGWEAFFFYHPIKMCEWKLGTDFMSKYGILPPNSFLQS